MNMAQHGVGASSYVAVDFEAVDIGAPFKVMLHGAVKVWLDKAGEQTGYSIPDPEGLFVAIVISRALHSRKLSGADIKFIRKVISLKQKDLARMLEMSVEHLSRCEAGCHVMSPTSEKLLRILSIKSAFKLHKMKACDAKSKLEDALDRLFDVFKVESAYDINDDLVLHFHRPRVGADGMGPDDVGPDDPDGDFWDEEPRKIA